jgi:hypothetical protein
MKQSWGILAASLRAMTSPPWWSRCCEGHQPEPGPMDLGVSLGKRVDDGTRTRDLRDHNAAL